MHFAAHRARAHVGGSCFGHHGFNVAAVAGEAIFAAVAKVANVADAAAGGDHLHQRTGDAVERDFAA